LIPLAAALLC